MQRNLQQLHCGAIFCVEGQKFCGGSTPLTTDLACVASLTVAILNIFITQIGLFCITEIGLRGPIINDVVFVHKSERYKAFHVKLACSDGETLAIQNWPQNLVYWTILKSEIALD